MAVGDTGRLFGKAGWNVLDQGLSAISNVVLSVMVARIVTAAGFGAFSTAFLLYGMAVAFTRSGVGTPLQIKFSSVAVEVRDAALRRALGCSCLIGLTATILAAGAGLVLRGQIGAALLAVACVFPALLLQDSIRMAMFASGRPAAAALIDAVWAVVQVGFLLFCVVAGLTGVAELILAWGLSAAVSVVLGLALLRVVPAPLQGWGWLRSERKLTGYLLGEYFVGLGAAQIGILLVGVLASTSAVGALRGAQVLLGPLGVMGAASFQFAVPEIARRPELDARRRTLFALAVSGGLGLVTIVYLIVLLLLPDSVGTALFGSSWTGAASVLLATGISFLASCLSNGPAGVLYGMGRAGWTFRINLAKGPLLIAVVAVTTLQWGMVGAAWGLASMEVVVLPAWWWTFRYALRHHTPSPVALTDAPERDVRL